NVCGDQRRSAALWCYKQGIKLIDRIERVTEDGTIAIIGHALTQDIIASLDKGTDRSKSSSSCYFWPICAIKPRMEGDVARRSCAQAMQWVHNQQPIAGISQAKSN